jgi:hypothetical protein
MRAYDASSDPLPLAVYTPMNMVVDPAGSSTFLNLPGTAMIPITSIPASFSFGADKWRVDTALGYTPWYSGMIPRSYRMPGTIGSSPNLIIDCVEAEGVYVALSSYGITSTTGTVQTGDESLLMTFDADGSYSRLPEHHLYMDYALGMTGGNWYPFGASPSPSSINAPLLALAVRDQYYLYGASALYSNMMSSPGFMLA